MPVSTSYAEFVIEQLSQVVRITSRKMFGGIGLYAGESFFASMDDDRIYFKVDDSNRADFETKGMKPFQPFADKQMTMQYYELPAEALEDIDELRVWVQKSVAVAKRAKPKKKNPNKKTRTS
jgi:DNA transformation protein